MGLGRLLQSMLSFEKFNHHLGTYSRAFSLTARWTTHKRRSVATSYKK